MTQATCISCSMDTGLVSVHDELTLDAESFWEQSSAAALAQYCFNFKIEKLDEPYGICSTCLGLLIQASSYKEHLLENINSPLHKKDAVTNTLFNEQLSKRDALVAKRNKLWNEVIGRSDFKTKIDLKKLDFLEIETTAKDVAERTVKEKRKHQSSALESSNSATRNNKTKIDLKKLDFLEKKTAAEDVAGRTLEKKRKRQSSALESSNSASRNCKIKIEESKTGKMRQPKLETTLALNNKLKSEFFALHKDCKDFHLFTWYHSKFKCTICNQSYGELDEFKKHVRKHTRRESENIFPKRFMYRGPELKVDVSNMKCRRCGERMTDFEEFRNHLSVAHKINSNYLFNRILPFDLQKDKHKCVICNEVFICVGNLNMHMNKHSKNYVCKHCEKPFATFYRLKNHTQRSHQPGVFPCTKCDEQFDNAGKRQYHMASVHSKIVNLCPHCPASFEGYVQKLRHLTEVHNEEAKRYTCKVCQWKFTTSARRGAHFRRVHLRERNYICGLCGDAFFNKQNLTNHMVKHTGERSFVCDICDKAYAGKKTLVAHKKTHDTNKVKYACEFCGNQYLYKGSLSVHLATCKKKV